MSGFDVHVITELLCVIASEICLTVNNVGLREITLEAVRQHLQDNEMNEVEGENLSGWADGTVRKHAVLLRINQFMPEFMNTNLQNLIQGSMDASQASADLTFDSKEAFSVRKWLFDQETAITQGFAMVKEKDFHLCVHKHRFRYEDETLPHLMTFLGVIGKKNKALIESFMNRVPKDIGTALGRDSIPIARAASDNRTGLGQRGGARELQPPFTPGASSSGQGVDAMDLINSDKEEDKVDIFGGGVMPPSMSVSKVVVSGSTKTQPVAEHVPVRWDSMISYNNCSEHQR